MSTDWRQQANCRTQDADVYFADRGRQSPRVLAPCTSCPVRKECLATALDSPWQPYGVWGGLPGKEVRRRWRDHPHNHPSDADWAVGLRRDRST